MQTKWRLTIVLVAALGVVAIARDKPNKSDAIPWEKAELRPGHGAKIDDPRTGGWGYWVVYVPKDYTPDRAWPIIYCYHGVDQEPKVWPFLALTDGVGYIIVGMEYVDRPIGAPKPEKELANLARIHGLLDSKLKIDQKHQFIGGFSQGGWETTHLAEHSPRAFAGGMIILGAGRQSDIASPQVRGMPIFIGAGEKDDNRSSGEAAAEFYRQHGGDVTIEVFKNIGHQVDTRDPVLKRWLKDHAGGPVASTSRPTTRPLPTPPKNT